MVPVNISEVIVHGVVFDPKNSENLRRMDLQQLLEAIPRLFELLDDREVNYVVVGGIAMLSYVPGRNTQDIGLILSEGDLERLPEIRIEEQNPEFARGWLGNLRLDFLLTTNKLFDEVARDHVELRRFVERDIPCATVEGLLLLKLYALPSLYRQFHFDRVELYERDLTQLMRDYQPDMDSALAALSHHLLKSDHDELRRIVREIEARIARQNQRFSSQDDAGGQRSPSP